MNKLHKTLLAAIIVQQISTPTISLASHAVSLSTKSRADGTSITFLDTTGLVQYFSCLNEQLGPSFALSPKRKKELRKFYKSLPPTMKLHGKKPKAVQQLRRRFNGKTDTVIKQWEKKYKHHKWSSERGQRYEAHHIIPLSYGGTDDLFNIIPLSHDCHTALHENTYFLRLFPLQTALQASALVPSAPLPALAPPSLQTKLDHALALYRDKKYVQALPKLHQIITARSTIPANRAVIITARLYKAYCYYFKSDIVLLSGYDLARESIALSQDQDVASVDKAKLERLLGFLYFEGKRGVAKNYTHAVKYYKQAVAIEQCDPFVKSISHYRLGSIYFKGGYGVEQSYTQARKHFDLVNFDRLPVADIFIGAKFYYTINNFDRAQELLSKVITHSQATEPQKQEARKLKKIMQSFTTTDGDYRQRVESWQKLASRLTPSFFFAHQDSPFFSDPALIKITIMKLNLYLAQAYFYGNGVSQSDYQAKLYCNKVLQSASGASLFDISAAKLLLGIMGYKTVKLTIVIDFFKQGAYTKFNELVQAPDIEITHKYIAQFYLGMCYYHGLSVTKDYAEALRRFDTIDLTQLCAQHQDLIIAFRGMILCQGGHGATKDLSQAKDCFLQVADSLEIDAESLSLIHRKLQSCEA